LLTGVLHKAPSARFVCTITTAPDDARKANGGIGTAYISTTTNIAVPNSLLPGADLYKGVTERQGVGANQHAALACYQLVLCDHDK
jgi:hypothetical protein